MKVNVTDTMRGLIIVYNNGTNVVSNPISLNSGTIITAEYVQKTEDNKANIHLVDGGVIINVERDNISFDKKVNNDYVALIEDNGGVKPKRRISPSIDVEVIPPPKIRRSCCGG